MNWIVYRLLCPVEKWIWWINWESCGSKLSWPVLKNISVSWEELKRINLTHDSRPLDSESNPWPSEYEARVLTSQSQCSAFPISSCHSILHNLSILWSVVKSLNRERQCLKTSSLQQQCVGNQHSLASCTWARRLIMLQELHLCTVQVWDWYSLSIQRYLHWVHCVQDGIKFHAPNSFCDCCFSCLECVGRNVTYFFFSIGEKWKSLRGSCLKYFRKLQINLFLFPSFSLSFILSFFHFQ
jgi:hypothetical protein